MSSLVPLVDLAAPDATEAIDRACRDVGFLSVVGHGVPGEVVARMLQETDAFFALPLEDKERYRPPSPSINRGYAAKGTEGLTYSLGVDGAPPDLFEAFNVGPEDQTSDANVWPEHERADAFRAAVSDYFTEARALAHRLTGLFAIALGVEPSFFESFTDRSTDTMRVNHYERGPGEPEPVDGQQRMGAHTDYGIVTVLYADPVPGLQIIGPDGAWHDVVPDVGTMLVNLGDLLAQWTNDRWRSTLHRVVPPPRTVHDRAIRRSVAFFHDGNDDALVECLPTCLAPGELPKYPAVRAGAHLRAKLLGPRTLTVSDALSTAGDRLR